MPPRLDPLAISPLATFAATSIVLAANARRHECGLRIGASRVPILARHDRAVDNGHHFVQLDAQLGEEQPELGAAGCALHAKDDLTDQVCHL